MPKQYGTPGPRLIYPSAATSQSLASCSVEAQLLFDRLLCQADDQGRLPGTVSVVRGLCVPLIERITSPMVARALASLEAGGMIIRYVAEGRDLIQVANWWEYQGNPRRIYPSRWPPPDGWQDRIRVEAERAPWAGQSPALGAPVAGASTPAGRPAASENTANGGPSAPFTRAGTVPSRPYSSQPVPANGVNNDFERRVAATKRQLHRTGGHSAETDAECPLCAIGADEAGRINPSPPSAPAEPTRSPVATSAPLAAQDDR